MSSQQNAEGMNLKSIQLMPWNTYWQCCYHLSLVPGENVHFYEYHFGGVNVCVGAGLQSIQLVEFTALNCLYKSDILIFFYYSDNLKKFLAAL